MGLNKKKFSTKLRSDITSLNAESERLYKTGRNLIQSKIRVNNSIVKKLELYLATLNDNFKSQIKKFPKMKSKKVRIIFASQSKFSQVNKLLTTELNKSGVVDGQSSIILKIAISLRSEYLNVEGFIKRTLELQFINESVKITKRYTQTGRTEEAIVEQILKELSDDIPEIFINLQI